MDISIAYAAARKDKVLQRWETMKRDRAGWDQLWRCVSDYLLPRRNVDALEVPGAVRPRRVVDNTGVVAADRLAATLHGFLLSPFSPFLSPKLDDGEPTREESLWFEDVQKRMHRYLSGSATNFRTQIAESLLDDVTMGTSPLWIGAERGRPPTFKACHVADCWIAENEETTQVDTIYRNVRMPLWRALERFPASVKLKEKAQKRDADLQETIKFLHAIEPNLGGVAKGPKFNKPFHDMTILLEGSEVVEAGGYDSFPFAVSRFQRLSSEPYGYSPGIQALPLIMGLNTLRDMVILQSELLGNPPLMDLTGGAVELIDRDPGGVTSVDPTLWRAFGNQPFQPLITPGDLRPAQQVVEDLRSQIQFTFYIDWLQLRDAANVTATEVVDRRDTRLKMMSSIVARLEQEKLNPIAERTFELMQAAGLLAPPPQSLEGRQISFEYQSPIARAQREQEIEASLRTLQFAAGAAQIDPNAARVLDVAELVRDAAKGYGVPEARLRAREDVLREIQAERDALAQQAGLDQASAAAGAAQQGAQAVATLAGAGGGA